MKITLVEDDNLQSELMIDNIRENFPEAEIELIETESQFIERFSNYSGTYPDIVIIDIMLRWANPEPDMPEPPPRIKYTGIYDAGFRCQKILEKNIDTAKIPVIFCSSIDKTDVLDKIPNNAIYIQKSVDVNAISHMIKKMLG